MTGSRHAIVLGIGLFALTLAGAARAQDLSAGKTPAQLFQLNCATCHKSARGLAAAGADKKGLFSGLEGFLAEHYTADPKSAEIIAAYLTSVGGAAPAHTKPHHRTVKPHKSAAKTETVKKADKTTDKKSEKADKTKSEKPKAEKSAMAKPKAAATATDKKKSASPSTQAKDQKPAAGDKKTD